MNDIKRLREALEDSNELLEELARLGEWWDAAKCQIKNNKEALAILAEPLRNCDRFASWEEAKDAYHLQMRCGSNSTQWEVHQHIRHWMSFCKWLFASAKEGGNDGGK